MVKYVQNKLLRLLWPDRFIQIVDALQKKIGINAESFDVNLIPTISGAEVYRLKITGQAKNNYFILKFYGNTSHKTEGSHEFASLQMLESKFLQLGGLYSVAKGVLYLPSLKCLVMAQSKHNDLRAILRKNLCFFNHRHNVNQSICVIHRVAEWIKIFQKVTHDCKIERFNTGLMVDSLLLRLEICRNNKYLDNCVAKNLHEKINQLKLILDHANYPVVGVHTDLRPPNILVGPEEIIVIDWSDFHPGNPYQDIGCFWAALDDLAINPLINGRLINLMQDELVNCFKTALAADILAFFQLDALCSFAGHMIGKKVNYSCTAPRDLILKIAARAHYRKSFRDFDASWLI